MRRHLCCALVHLLLLLASPITADNHTRGGLSIVGHWKNTIVIGTHHKTGTVLFAKVFRVICKMMDVVRIKSNRTLHAMACGELLSSFSPGVCIIEHVTARDVHDIEHRPPHEKPPFVHAVRDPVEMCVSAYQYHLLGPEPWLVQPMRDLNGSTIQQYYQRLPPAEGVRFECLRMTLELVESALVYNRTRRLPHVLTTRLEDFAKSYDATMREVFTFLGSGPHVEELVTASQVYDLARAPPQDARHVSAASSKQALRDFLLHGDDPRITHLLVGLRELLGYCHTNGSGECQSTDGPRHPKNHAHSSTLFSGRDALCEELKLLCATTRVGFFQWCSYGRIPRGRIPSLPDCGEAVVLGPGGKSKAAGSSPTAAKVHDGL